MIIEKRISMNENYTNEWIINFDKQKLQLYHQKFYRNFEKNIKFCQQVDFIKKYIRYEMEWLDAAIGTGRLMEEIHCKTMMGLDKSPVFVEYNNKRGIKTVQGDLFNIPFKEQFDIVTCMHTLFAFNEFRTILKGLVSALKKNGILIVDIVNRSHIEASNPVCGEYPYQSAVSREEITAFFDSIDCDVLEIVPHDFYDNRFILHWRNANNIAVKAVKKALYIFLNVLYFKLGMKRFFERYSSGWNEKYYVKYLIAARKR